VRKAHYAVFLDQVWEFHHFYYIRLYVFIFDRELMCDPCRFGGRLAKQEPLNEHLFHDFIAILDKLTEKFDSAYCNITED
jgi:hypothetical protein